MILPWQHIGNKKSDSPYPMENADNQNNTNHIAQTKLFKPSFQGASWNNVRLLRNSLFMRVTSKNA